MADLFIDADVVRRSRGRLQSITEMLDGPCRAMGSMPRDAVEQKRLRDKLSDFGDEWEWGIGKLGDFSGSAADALQQILDAFDEVDVELKTALDEAAEEAA